jgi:hypothetical protein
MFTIARSDCKGQSRISSMDTFATTPQTVLPGAVDAVAAAAAAFGAQAPERRSGKSR